MNIINFIKKNAMAMVAAVAIIGFSSFNLVENYNSAGLMWYPVDATGNISSTGNSSPTSGCSDQQLPIVCEIQLESNPNGTPPANHIDDTQLEGGSVPFSSAKFREEN
ncbi:hypothetical protein SF1_34810 [Sphingobacterium faecium NBRC 15299]|jgi:hypothetical protein|uniref:hypothetical protein n=2 Tax=Sphingobacteriaceae TaxID=84566 RepID=UPI0004E5F07C|nr:MULTISPECIES: hypothetical protein [Sphingobacterium]PTX08270.1 hypothetical protein C8N37_10985 [Sphingobacterium faecium]GEM65499.1 hypothetical protein SF1_34810 [Sphingobacterium faecium NBRC 15299]CDS93775.1 exported hypothetical protein [Sphingobacterium sp. PM2-P1-29]